MGRLTNDQLTALEAALNAQQAWNACADAANQWDTLDADERRNIITIWNHGHAAGWADHIRCIEEKGDKRGDEIATSAKAVVDDYPVLMRALKAGEVLTITCTPLQAGAATAAPPKCPDGQRVVKSIGSDGTFTPGGSGIMNNIYIDPIARTVSYDWTPASEDEG